MERKAVWTLIAIVLVLVLASAYYLTSSEDFKRSGNLVGDGVCGNLPGDERGACCANVHDGEPTIECVGSWQYLESSDSCQFVCGGLEVKTFVLTGENFKFVMDGQDNPNIVVNQGDTVRIEFTSTSGFHDWVVDEFDAATSKIRDGEGMVAVEFVADEIGEFEYYCSVGQHRANGMFGKFIVQ